MNDCSVYSTSNSSSCDEIEINSVEWNKIEAKALETLKVEIDGKTFFLTL